ncbi:hypothetical protein TTRE_0000384201 [Trichuris trichiura]|uniref:Uncharacterized protein n=1 Tax=Trichuris trichiura TaxID=36087 RepID=A0A077Z6W8_TRITR|nr:hypothetical protein TTRE_0000384201 [Trichuris trichiura]
MKQKRLGVHVMRPTEPIIDVDLFMELVTNWHREYENDGTVVVHDDGLVQYQLIGHRSHHIFYAALVLNKETLTCSVSKQAPVDELMNNGNLLHFSRLTGGKLEKAIIRQLKDALEKRGYTFL